MSRIRWGASSIALGLGMIVACDDDVLVADFSESADGGGGDDGSLLPPPTEGGVDSGQARRDAAPPEASKCSIDGFCWTTVPEKQTLRAVWGDGGGNVWAVSLQGNVLRWDGSAWTIHWKSPGPLRTIWGSGPTDLWAGGDKGLLHGQGPSPDSISWTPVAFDAATPVFSIAGSGPNDVWAVGARTDTSSWPYRLISLAKHYTGPTANPDEAWATDPISYRPGLLRRVLVRPGGDAWLAGDWEGRYPTPPAYVLHRVPAEGGGATWAEQAVPYDSRDMLANVYGAGFVGDDIRILGWRATSRVTSTWVGAIAGGAGSEVWTEETAPVSIYSHYTVWGTSKSDVYLAGAFGRFRHFDGTAWSLVRISIDGLPVTNDFFASWINPNKEIWIVGDKIALRKPLTP